MFKAKFQRMLEQARKYRLVSLDQALQAMIVVNACYDLQKSEFAVKTEQMVELLTGIRPRRPRLNERSR